MTAHDPVITELAEANPVSGETSSDPGDRAEAERIMRRVLAGDQGPPPQRWRRSGLLAPVVSVVVVLAVAAVLLRTGGSSHGSPSSGGSPTITLVAEPTSQTPRITSSALTRELSLVRQRLATVNRHFSVTRGRGNSLVITVPGASAAQRARLLALVTQTAQLTMYDWEANVVAPNGRTVAQDLRTQSPAVIALSQGANRGAGQSGAGSLPLYDAVKLAAKQPPRALSPSMARTGPEYYMFGAPGSPACAAAAAAAHTAPVPGTHCLLAGPLDLPGHISRQRALQAFATQLSAGVSAAAGQVLAVPQGTRVLQALAPEQVDAASPAAQFFVLRDDVALNGHDIVSPRRTADASGQSAVSFGLTAAGERLFQATTRAVARRGDEASTLGETLDQHFAIVLDSRLLTVPSIDFKQYPDGIQTTQADIAGGFTRQSAGDLATQLRYGALPLALRVVR